MKTPDQIRIAHLQKLAAELQATAAKILMLTGPVPSGKSLMLVDGPAPEGMEDLEKLLDLVLKHFKVSRSEFFSRRRFGYIVVAHHCFSWLARRLTQHSLDRVGQFLGMDHKAVFHGVKSNQNRRDTEPKFRMQTDALMLAARTRLGVPS